MNREHIISGAIAGLTFTALLYLFFNVLHWSREYSWPQLLLSGVIYTVLYTFIGSRFWPKKQQNEQEK